MRAKLGVRTVLHRYRALTVCALGMLAACGSSSSPPEQTVPPADAPPATGITLSEEAAPTVDPAGGEPPPSTVPATTHADPSPSAERYKPVFVPGPCPFQLPSGTDPDCGRLTVPESRDDPAGRRIELAVAVFPALSDELYPPVAYLEGGPGGEALEALPFSYDLLFGFLNRERTVVVFDQRGVGYSTPSLACPELLDLTYDLLDEDIPDEEYSARERAVINECRDGWLRAGVDLSRYNSAESAADVADLRRALGYDEWDLFGVSYGTRLALTVMRDHPEGIRSVILDSTYPPEIDGVASILPGADRSFSELFEACASDTRCDAAYGDLEELLFSAVERLNAEPAEVWVVDFLTFEGYPALLSGDILLGLVYQGLYSDLIIPGLPRMVADAAQGRFFEAQTLMSLFLSNQAFLSVGQFLSVECHEEVPFSDADRVATNVAEHPRLAPLVAGAMAQSEDAYAFCREWGAGVADPIENRPVDSDIPTLVLSGRFDPITGPEFGRRVAERLAHGWFVEFPTLGHGTATSEGCPQSLILAFLEDPPAQPDTACVADMDDIVFEVFDPAPEISLAEARVGSYRVLVPAGWEGEGGIYRRGSAGDLTSFMVIPGPPGFAETILTAVKSAWTGAVMEESAELAVGDITWRRLSAEAGSVSIEAALHEGDDGSIIVALVSDQREKEYLFGQVVMPALENLNPVGL